MFRTRMLRAAAFMAVALLIRVLQAQSPPIPLAAAPGLGANQSATAAITFSNGTSLRVFSGKDGNFPLVAANPDETVNIQVRCAAIFLKNGLVVQALDGGTIPIAQQNSTLAPDGTATIQFQAPSNPGLYRILLRASGLSATLNFWVAGAQNESPNPAALKP